MHLSPSLSARSVPRAAIVLGSLLLALVLAGCNSSASNEPGAAGGGADPSAGAGAASGTSYPLTLRTPYGETTLQSRPSRVAVVGPVTDLDNVLALGVTPVFAPEFATGWPWIDQQVVGEIESTVDTSGSGGSGELPFEEIAASTPDVIIAVTETGLEQNFERLSQIAPVVALPDSPPSSQADWKQSLQVIGTALDRTDQAEALIADTEQQIEQVRSDHPEFDGKSITFAIDYGGDYGLVYYNYQGSPAEDLLTELGFAPGDHAGEFDATANQVSAENLPLLDSDVVLVNFNGGKAQRTAMEENKIFQQLTAVQQDRYLGLLPTDGEASPLAWSLARPSATNLQWSISFLEPKLAQVVGGAA